MPTLPPSSKPVFAGLALVLLATAACHPKSLAQAKRDTIGGGVHISTSEMLPTQVEVADRLDCPDQQGALRRTAAAADGRSCDYASDRGVVRLALMDAPGGDARAALAPVKAELDAMLPKQADGATMTVVSEKGADGKDVSKVDMPFMHVSDDGKHSRVKMFGFTIDSDKDGKTARSSVNVTGDDDDKPVAPAGSRGSEMVYLLAGAPASPQGYHAVGYVARGDAAGRMVVATFKYRSGDEMNHGDHHDSDLDRLIDLNAKKG